MTKCQTGKVDLILTKAISRFGRNSLETIQALRELRSRGVEMIASEGTDDLFYWRCVNDQCYARSIDQRHPVDGEIRCKKCDSPVEFSIINTTPLEDEQISAFLRTIFTSMI